MCSSDFISMGEYWQVFKIKAKVGSLDLFSCQYKFVVAARNYVLGCLEY